MTEQLQALCNRFIRNRDTIKEEFYWDSQYIIAVCASSLTEKGVDITQEQLAHCHKLLKEKTGIFSDFRAYTELPITAMVAIDSNPEKRLADTFAIHGVLKKYFRGDSYTALVAAIISEWISVEEAEAIAAKGRAVYDMMRKAHPFLTDGEDSVFAVLMAFSAKEDKLLFEDAEECYSLLRRFAATTDTAQNLAHVLSLFEGAPAEKCSRTRQLYDLIVGKRAKYSKHYELGVLGALAMSVTNLSTVAAEIAEVDTFLDGQKGYSGFTIDKKTRAMHAALIVSCQYIDRSLSANATAAITGTVAVLAAQQAALCAIIAVNAAT